MHVSDGFPKKSLDGGWVSGVSSIQVFFWIFAKPLSHQSQLSHRINEDILIKPVRSFISNGGRLFEMTQIVTSKLVLIFF